MSPQGSPALLQFCALINLFDSALQLRLCVDGAYEGRAEYRSAFTCYWQTCIDTLAYHASLEFGHRSENMHLRATAGLLSLVSIPCDVATSAVPCASNSPMTCAMLQAAALAPPLGGTPSFQ
jgi:hypothetical protein